MSGDVPLLSLGSHDPYLQICIAQKQANWPLRSGDKLSTESTQLVSTFD